MIRSDIPNATDNKELVLFLSRDNYCCGRYCEELFNHLAAESGLDWKGISRALHDGSGSNWTYSMSPIATDFLRRRHVSARQGLRPPLGVTTLDFRLSSVVIALDKSQDRAKIDQDWQQYANRVRFWEGCVLNLRLPNDVFDMLEHHVVGLIQELTNDRALHAA